MFGVGILTRVIVVIISEYMFINREFLKYNLIMFVFYFIYLFYFILFYFIYLFFVFLLFLGPLLRLMEVPRLGVRSELQLPAYTTATATLDP